MRNALINWLTEKATKHSEIIFITADLGYSVVEAFSNTHKERFINAGVAEQNMTGISAGLALEGFRPYNYSIGIFPTFRCAEQIRNDIDYHNLPVVICAIGSGVAYGNLGYSHHAIQDLSLMRSMPNMMIGTPSDPEDVIKILNYQFENPGPLYLRLHKAGEKNLRSSKDEIKPGIIKRLTATDRALESTTCVLCIGHIASRVIDFCSEQFPQYQVYSVPLWGGQNSKYFSDQIKRFKTIITIEDHVLEGGFGSFTLEVAAKYRLDSEVIPIALRRDIVGKVAKEETLLKPLMEDLSNCLNEITSR